MTPTVYVDLTKFKENLLYLTHQCQKHHLSLMAVTKVFSADQKLIDVINDVEPAYIADSRIDNLKQIETKLPKVLLRLPALSEVEEVVQYADISLNSELKTIKALNESAEKHGKIHQIILMIDLGDLREGIFEKEELHSVVKKLLTFSHIKLLGLGTNLTCYGGVIPTVDVLNKLIQHKQDLEDTFDITIQLVSGGNSSSLELMFNNNLPKGITNLRLGESLVLGRETAYGKSLKNMHSDIFTLEAEIIELKNKPSVPIGPIGMNALGEKVTFEDKGIQKRAILNIGRQDINHTNIIVPNNISILGSSSDHLLLDVTHYKKPLSVGDTLRFKLTYGGILSLFTSKYVRRSYV
ncbi:MAG: alanine/ornithine racemase family PLP-dependent enzyme [Candidatus Izimaplasma sp.]|nr:alanine/ornithine racemase family PLP-dependent enzyme [Candidatus Izimaplasma bacterium]